MCNDSNLVGYVSVTAIYVQIVSDLDNESCFLTMSRSFLIETGLVQLLYYYLAQKKRLLTDDMYNAMQKAFIKKFLFFFKIGDRAKHNHCRTFIYQEQL